MGPAPNQQKSKKLEVVVDFHPDHRSAWLVCQRRRHTDTNLLLSHSGLELDVPYDTPSLQDEVNPCASNSLRSTSMSNTPRDQSARRASPMDTCSTIFSLREECRLCATPIFVQKFGPGSPPIRETIPLGAANSLRWRELQLT